MGASTAPKPIGGRVEVGLEYGLQHQLQRHLHHSVFERGDTQRPEFPRFARLRDQPLPDGLGLVGSIAQFFPNLFEESSDATGTPFDLVPRHPVGSRCLAARVLGQPLPGHVNRSAVTNQIEQICEHLSGVCSTPPIQLALHVEDKPGIHRVGHQPASCLHSVPTAFLRHVDGFPVLGLLRRLRPPYSRSSVASIILPRLRPEASKEFSGSVDNLLSTVGADFTPCGIRPSGLAGFPESWCPMSFGHPRFASLQREPALHRSCDRPAHFRIGEVPLNGASAIGSVSLSMTDTLAGP